MPLRNIEVICDPVVVAVGRAPGVFLVADLPLPARDANPLQLFLDTFEDPEDRGGAMITSLPIRAKHEKGRDADARSSEGAGSPEIRNGLSREYRRWGRFH